MSKLLDIYLKEGMINKALCKKNQLGIKMNIKNLNSAKKALSNCEQFKKSNPSKYKACKEFYSKYVNGAQKGLDRCKVSAKKYCNDNVSESVNLVLENFLQSLYTDNRSQAKEWRGANIPIGDDSNRPNLIGKCFTLESDKMKINCLRKLREQAAMNPFYQARLDRFVDAITQRYEPTPQQGTVSGSEFKSTAVGEDLKESYDKVTILGLELGLEVFFALFKRYATEEKRLVQKKCGKILKDDMKALCKVRVKLQFQTKLLKELESKRNLCKQAKDPKKCSKQLTKKMKRIRQNIHFLDQDFKRLTKFRQQQIADNKRGKK